jgi:hypothetical protein
MLPGFGKSAEIGFDDKTDISMPATTNALIILK